MPQKTEHITLDARIEKLRKGRGIFNFEGCLCEQVIGGWKIFDTLCSTPEQVLELIDKGYKTIEGSLVVSVKGGFCCQNDFEVANLKGNT